MLKEFKCLICSNFDFNKSNCFKHVCKAYPNGIPEKIFNDNKDDKNCHSEICNFEYKQNND